MKVKLERGTDRATLECSKIDLYNLLHITRRWLASNNANVNHYNYTETSRKFLLRLDDATNTINRILDEEDAIDKEYC